MLAGARGEGISSSGPLLGKTWASQRAPSQGAHVEPYPQPVSSDGGPSCFWGRGGEQASASQELQAQVGLGSEQAGRREHDPGAGHVPADGEGGREGRCPLPCSLTDRKFWGVPARHGAGGLWPEPISEAGGLWAETGAVSSTGLPGRDLALTHTSLSHGCVRCARFPARLAAAHGLLCG